MPCDSYCINQNPIKRFAVKVSYIVAGKRTDSVEAACDAFLLDFQRSLKMELSLR